MPTEPYSKRLPPPKSGVLDTSLLEPLTMPSYSSLNGESRYPVNFLAGEREVDSGLPKGTRRVVRSHLGYPSPGRLCNEGGVLRRKWSTVKLADTNKEDQALAVKAKSHVEKGRKKSFSTFSEALRHMQISSGEQASLEHKHTHPSSGPLSPTNMDKAQWSFDALPLRRKSSDDASSNVSARGSDSGTDPVSRMTENLSDDDALHSPALTPVHTLRDSDDATIFNSEHLMPEEQSLARFLCVICRTVFPGSPPIRCCTACGEVGSTEKLLPVYSNYAESESHSAASAPLIEHHQNIGVSPSPQPSSGSASYGVTDRSYKDALEVLKLQDYLSVDLPTLQQYLGEALSWGDDSSSQLVSAFATIVEYQDEHGWDLRLCWDDLLDKELLQCGFKFDGFNPAALEFATNLGTSQQDCRERLEQLKSVKTSLPLHTSDSNDPKLGQNAKGWAAEKDQILLDLNTTTNYSWSLIAEELNLDAKECKRRFKEIKPKGWKPKTKKQIKKDAEANISAAYLAPFQERMDSHNICKGNPSAEFSKLSKGVTDWSDTDDSRLLELKGASLSWGEISQILERTTTACKQRFCKIKPKDRALDGAKSEKSNSKSEEKKDSPATSAGKTWDHDMVRGKRSTANDWISECESSVWGDVFKSTPNVVDAGWYAKQDVSLCTSCGHPKDSPYHSWSCTHNEAQEAREPSEPWGCPGGKYLGWSADWDQGDSCPCCGRSEDSPFSPLLCNLATYHIPSSQTQSARFKPCTVNYQAVIKSGEREIHVPIDRKHVSGPEKTIVTTGMPKVWKWVYDMGLGDKVGLQNAFDLARSMHEDEFDDAQGWR